MSGKRSRVPITWRIRCTKVTFQLTVFRLWQLHMHLVSHDSSAYHAYCTGWQETRPLGLLVPTGPQAKPLQCNKGWEHGSCSYMAHQVTKATTSRKKYQVMTSLWDKVGTPSLFREFYLHKNINNGLASFQFLLSTNVNFPPGKKTEEIKLNLTWLVFRETRRNHSPCSREPLRTCLNFRSWALTRCSSFIPQWLLHLSYHQI